MIREVLELQIPHLSGILKETYNSARNQNLTKDSSQNGWDCNRELTAIQCTFNSEEGAGIVLILFERALKSSDFLPIIQNTAWIIIGKVQKYNQHGLTEPVLKAQSATECFQSYVEFGMYIFFSCGNPYTMQFYKTRSLSRVLQKLFPIAFQCAHFYSNSQAK